MAPPCQIGLRLTPFMIHCNSGGRFTEGSHLKHCKPYVFSAYSNQKFLCEWLCIMTDQISGFLHQSMTGNLFYSFSY